LRLAATRGAAVVADDRPVVGEPLLFVEPPLHVVFNDPNVATAAVTSNRARRWGSVTVIQFLLVRDPTEVQ
jgi:hypothetical protein